MIWLASNLLFSARGIKMRPSYYKQVHCLMAAVVILTFLFKTVRCRLPLPDGCPEACSCNEILLHVNCSSTDMTSMPRVANNTRWLDLDGNQLKVVEKWFFAHMTNLRMLLLANNLIDEIQETGFKYQRKLVHLDLSGNQLGEVPVALNNLRNLKELSLSGNQIGMLSKEPWSNLTKLNVLLLDYNSIPNLPWVMTSKLQRLRTLSISYNEITSISPGQFLNATNLEYLDLSHNNLKTKTDSSGDANLDYFSIPLATVATDAEYRDDEIAEGLSVKSLKGLFNLKELNMAGNNIQRLENGIFSDLYSLEILNLDRNGLEYIQDMVFREQYQLQILTLSENALVELSHVTFEDLRLLEVLKLDNNNLVDISPLTNVHMFHLHMLSLDNNRIKTIDARGFTGFKVIEEIFLQNNRLKYVPEVRNLSRLQHLDLSGNRIKEIMPVNAFDGTSLVTLNLEYNRLESIDFNTFASLKSLSTIRVDGNNFICDCRLSWVIDYYSQYTWLRYDYTDMLVEKQIICQSPTLIYQNTLIDGKNYQRGLWCTEYANHHNVLMLVYIWGGILASFLVLFWTYTYCDFKRRFYVRIPRKRYLLIHNSDKNDTFPVTGNHCKVRFRSYDTESESYIYDEETTV